LFTWLSTELDSLFHLFLNILTVNTFVKTIVTSILLSILLIRLLILWIIINILFNIQRDLHRNLLVIFIKLDLWGEHVKLSATLFIISFFHFLQISVINVFIIKSVLYVHQFIMFVMMIGVTKLSTNIYRCYIHVTIIIIIIIININISVVVDVVVVLVDQHFKLFLTIIQIFQGYDCVLECVRTWCHWVDCLVLVFMLMFNLWGLSDSKLT